MLSALPDWRLGFITRRYRTLRRRCSVRGVRHQGSQNTFADGIGVSPVTSPTAVSEPALADCPAGWWPGGIFGRRGATPSGTSGQVRITERDTPAVVSQAISVRLDDEAMRALAQLATTGLSRSAAIRAALMTAAARLRDRENLATEAASLEADEHDRAETRAVAELMEQLRA